MVHMCRRAFLAILVIPLAAHAAGPAEQRCVELGTECTCSEPLDFVDSGITGLYDPPDSEGAGAVECGGGVAIDTQGPIDTVTAASVGLSGPSHVLRSPSDLDGQVTDDSRIFDDGTYCLRSYFRYSDSFPAPGVLERVKGPRNTNGGAHPGFESQWDNSGASDPEFQFAPQGNNGTPFGTVASGGALACTGYTFGFSDCKQSWCRVEVCYDHNLDADQKLSYRGRLVKLSDGSTMNCGPEKSVNSSPIADSGNDSFPAMWFVSGIGSGHFTYFSHAMTAIRTTADQDFWIGPAYEIEDFDQDGIANRVDNCSRVPSDGLLYPSVPAGQNFCDIDSDGYGGPCDCDTDGDFICQITDQGILGANFGNPATPAQPTDLDCDGITQLTDFGVFGLGFGGPPGESGLACAGTANCTP